MKIGTPLSSNALKVMFLGGGELGKEVVIALQRFGVETIVIDRYQNTPAMQVAHHHRVINMTDPIILAKTINEFKPNIIVPEIEAIATEVLLEIEQNNIAIVIPTARAVNLTMNRKGIRKLAAEELGLPTSKYKFATSLDELTNAINEIGVPCFIKPIMSSSGKGQSFIKTHDEINSAWEYAKTSGRVDKCEVIVESRIDFDYEITLLTVRAKTFNGEVETHYCNPIGHRQVAGDYVESWQMQEMSEKALVKAQYIAKAVTDDLGGLGVFGVELFIKGDEVWFSEVSPRPHDTGMVTMITQYQSEFELHARAILGLPVDTRQREIGASHVIYAGIDGESLVYSNINKALSILNTDLRLFGKPEGFIKRRMGVALATALDVDSARELAQKVATTVVVSQ